MSANAVVNESPAPRVRVRTTKIDKTTTAITANKATTNETISSVIFSSSACHNSHYAGRVGQI
jgi:hypothetical protein